MEKLRKTRLKSDSTATGETRDFHLQVAQLRLQESTDQADALEAIREIVSNLLGSEEIALFKVEEAKATLRLFWSFGIDTGRYSMLVALQSPVLQRVLDGEPYVEGALERTRDGGLADDFHAFVPICFRNQTVAILAIRRLLPQKSGLDQADIELLRLLSGEAGEALFGKELEYDS